MISNKICTYFLHQRSIYEEFPALAHKKIFDQKTINENVANESIKSLILTWFNGLKLYINYPTFTAGFGLACLYMTVLGFDNITYGHKSVKSWVQNVENRRASAVNSIMCALGK